MTGESWIGLVGAILGFAGLIFGTIRSGKTAKEVALADPAGDAYDTAVSIYDKTLAMQGKQIEELGRQMEKQGAEIESLKTARELDAVRFRAATRFIGQLLTYIRLHVFDRTDIPTIPAELVDEVDLPLSNT